jgi:hypothetical protein
MISGVFTGQSVEFPNSGAPESGYAPKLGANPNALDLSRDGPHLCPASPFTSPSTQVSVRLFHEVNYISTLETLHGKHPPYAKSPLSLVTDLWKERTLHVRRRKRVIQVCMWILLASHTDGTVYFN